MTTQTMPGYFRDDNWFQKMMRMKTFWILFWCFLFSYPVYRSLNRQLPPPLPVYYSVPEFSLTNEFNKPFGSADLKGKFYIANFMFTSCPTSCPALMDKMDLIQKRIRGLGTKAAIVTFTVDPTHDTPAVLFKYARKRNTNPYVWNFLTGTKADLEKILINGFKVPMGNKEPVTKLLDTKTITLMDIVHSDRVVLVDTKGQIRGYYATDKIEMDRLMIDLGLLVNNSFSKPKADPTKKLKEI